MQRAGGSIVASGNTTMQGRAIALNQGHSVVVVTNLGALAEAGIAGSLITNGLTHGRKNIQSLISERGVGGKGWKGDKNWRQNVNRVKQGGTIHDLNGEIPTQQEAIELINEAGGTVNRIEGPHSAPNPHNFPHINYTTSNGLKGTIRIK